MGGASYIGLGVKIVNRGCIKFGSKVIVRPSTCIYANGTKSMVCLSDGVDSPCRSRCRALSCRGCRQRRGWPPWQLRFSWPCRP